MKETRVNILISVTIEEREGYKSDGGVTKSEVISLPFNAALAIDMQRLYEALLTSALEEKEMLEEPKPEADNG